MAIILVHSSDGGDHLVAGLFDFPDYTAEEAAVFYRGYLARREVATSTTSM